MSSKGKKRSCLGEEVRFIYKIFRPAGLIAVPNQAPQKFKLPLGPLPGIGLLNLTQMPLREREVLVSVMKERINIPEAVEAAAIRNAIFLALNDGYRNIW